MGQTVGMETCDFRIGQVLGDLLQVVGGKLGDGPVTADPGGAGSEQIWGDLAGALYTAVEAGFPAPQLEQAWRDKAKTVRAAPAQVRAALMNGFAHLCDLRLIAEECRPGPDDVLTRPQAGIESALMAIARKMTTAERDSVAQADHGSDAARHRAALDDLLQDDRLAYPPGESWFPAEVIELVSHVPGHPGHVPCMAIVLLDALRTGDARGDAEYRFSQQSRGIERLDPPIRDIFLAAFRHLYEGNRDWCPVPTDHGRSGATYQAILPWTGDLPDALP